MNRPIFGLDMSVTSPGLCVNFGEQVFFYFMAKRKKHENFKKIVESLGVTYHFIALNYPEYEVREGRYEDMCNTLMAAILPHKTHDFEKIYVEGFAYGARGRGVSSLYESGAIIRNKLYKADFDIEEVSPTSLKKSASGKGNSNKLVMYRCFSQDTGLDLFEILGLKVSLDVPKPSEDIVDSWYLTLHATRLHNNTSKQLKLQKKKVTTTLIERLQGSCDTKETKPHDNIQREVDNATRQGDAT